MEPTVWQRALHPAAPPPFADTVPPPSRLIIIPDMLKNAPMFKKVQTLRKQAAGGSKGKGKGKDAAKK